MPDTLRFAALAHEVEHDGFHWGFRQTSGGGWISLAAFGQLAEAGKEVHQFGAGARA